MKKEQIQQLLHTRIDTSDYELGNLVGSGGFADVYELVGYDQVLKVIDVRENYNRLRARANMRPEYSDTQDFLDFVKQSEQELRIHKVVDGIDCEYLVPIVKAFTDNAKNISGISSPVFFSKCPGSRPRWNSSRSLRLVGKSWRKR